MLVGMVGLGEVLRAISCGRIDNGAPCLALLANPDCLEKNHAPEARARTAMGFRLSSLALWIGVGTGEECPLFRAVSGCRFWSTNWPFSNFEGLAGGAGLPANWGRAAEPLAGAGYASLRRSGPVGRLSVKGRDGSSSNMGVGQQGVRFANIWCSWRGLPDDFCGRLFLRRTSWVAWR